eukprot:249009-Amorphochlora_amoeboformis.AAC.2
MFARPLALRAAAVVAPVTTVDDDRFDFWRESRGRRYDGTLDEVIGGDRGVFRLEEPDSLGCTELERLVFNWGDCSRLARDDWREFWGNEYMYLTG